MIADHAGGIAFNQAFQTLFLHHLLKNDFRRRRTADVAQADKQDSVGFGSIHERHFFSFRIGKTFPRIKREEFPVRKTDTRRDNAGSKAQNAAVPPQNKIPLCFGLRQRVSGCRLSHGRSPSWIKF